MNEANDFFESLPPDPGLRSWPDHWRSCELCGLRPRRGNRDHCIPILPDPEGGRVIYACCGHGQVQPSVIIEWDSTKHGMQLNGCMAADALWPDDEQRAERAKKMQRLLAERQAPTAP